MLKAMVFYGLSALAFAGSVAKAEDSCDTYAVIPGDTLRLISERYYGARELSPLIYEANSRLIGADPNTIEIGMELSIPCQENMQIPQQAAYLAMITQELESSDDIVPQFIVRAGDTPFYKQDNSGIIPEVIAAALKAGGFRKPTGFTRPENISDILQASAEPNALLSFPWALPSCDDTASLSPQSAYICDHYTFSDPLYEITLGIFTPADNALATAHNASGFAGATVCVPQFHNTDLLSQNGISETSTNIVLAPDFQSCLDGIASGSYDAIVADYQSFGTFVSADSNLTDIPAFAQKSTLHAMAFSQNPAAVEVLNMVNAGMGGILMTGEWFSIVNEHLSPPRH